MSNFVEIGDVIRPWGSSNQGIVISKMNKDRVAKCIWNDGTVSSVYIDNITFYGKVFKDLALTQKRSCLMWQKIKCCFIEGAATMAGMLAFLYLFGFILDIVNIVER